MTERQYDEEIAPVLLELVEKCGAAGMAFTATVEYEPGQRGTTAAGIDANNIDMLVPYLAGQFGGRLDDLLFSLSRRIMELGLPHSCVCLQHLGVPLKGKAPL